MTSYRCTTCGGDIFYAAYLTSWFHDLIGTNHRVTTITDALPKAQTGDSR